MIVIITIIVDITECIISIDDRIGGKVRRRGVPVIRTTGTTGSSSCCIRWMRHGIPYIINGGSVGLNKGGSGTNPIQSDMGIIHTPIQYGNPYPDSGNILQCRISSSSRSSSSATIGIVGFVDGGGGGGMYHW